MIHPSERYFNKEYLVFPKCSLEGREVEVTEYARDVETGIRYYSGKCECAWAGTNLQYLEYQYDLKHSR